MAELLPMPEVAAGSTSAVLSSWPVAAGASFGQGDSLIVVETDKAEVDVPADADGTLLATLVPAGAEVEVGSPIAVIGAVGEQVDDLDALLVRLGVGADGGGGGGARTAERRDVPVGLPQASGAASEDDGTSEPSEPSGRIFASPLARRLAREAGLPIESITGTGPGGRIVRDDVRAAVAGRTGGADAAVRTDEAAASGEARPSEPVAPVAAPAPAAARPERLAAEPSGAYEDIPHTRIRRAIAARLTGSKQNAPHFYLRSRVRADALLELRRQLNATGGSGASGGSGGSVKISVNDLLVKAVALAHAQVPEMNAVWLPDAVRRFAAVDVAVAIATDNGLVTPVLRNVTELSLSGISRGVRTYAEQARTGSLRQGDLEGGAITISNLGMYGVEEFAAIINPPQSAILAVGAATREPVVTADGTVEAAQVLALTLSVDHRPVDGALAARWFAALREIIEEPMRILV
ncbi:2-oxo acid dehydrogenase subunit E2 [Streptomyces sp. NPDC057654]|uniref:2-oxo acid dehydrogenase subunit E2 n=1 Tax=Streptomyces sp. NPDC057654 TaxID=3346196 RepID=UPI0036C5F3E0